MAFCRSQTRHRPGTQLISKPACQTQLMGSHRGFTWPINGQAHLAPSSSSPPLHCAASIAVPLQKSTTKERCVLFHTHFCPSRPAHSVAGFSCSLGAASSGADPFHLHPPPPNHPPLPRVPTDGGLEPARSPSTTVTRQHFLQIKPSFSRMFT